MYIQIKENIRKSLEDATKEQITLDEIQESEIADFTSTLSFKLASKRRKSPVDIAEELVQKIKPPKVVEHIEAVNGYINFFLDYSEFILLVMDDIKSKEAEYGKLKKKKEKIVLEHTSVNPSGPLHVGRLRNSIIGDSLVRILRFSGYEVETHYYVNDVGKQIAIIAQGFKEGVEPDKNVVDRYKKYKSKPDFQIFFEYVASNQQFESNEEFQRRVQDLIKRAEYGDQKSLEEIKQVANTCLKGQKETFKELDISFDYFDFESEYIKKVRDVIDFLMESKYAKTIDEGFGLDLASFGLKKRVEATILARADHTSVYLAKDIAYHLEKIKRGDLLINVLGEDHKFEFQELKTILTEFYDIKVPLDVVHFSFVNFEGEQLSTRLGQIASVDELIDDAIEKAKKEIKKREIASLDIAPWIGIGAIKYHLIKRDPLKPITFKWEEALSFDGESSPYIQYAHARSCRILENAKIKVEDIDMNEIINKIDLNLKTEEKKLIKLIARFPEIIEKSAKELKPNLIANYLYELASEFSRFYKNCRVLDAGKGIEERRLLLVDATRKVIKNGLGLLGIEAPERM